MRPLLPPGLATGLIAATLLTAPTAHAAAETCQGRPATIVGTPGQYVLSGTEGDDVIVTNGATPTLGHGGNDLICVTGGTSPLLEVSVDAGAGDDVVDASAVNSRVGVELGAGSDTYSGSLHDETVHGGTNGFDGGRAADTERDTITTGAGGTDRVVSGSERTVLNTDVVVLAGGGTLAWIGPLAAGGRLDGGPAGGSTLAFEVGSGHVFLDAREGVAGQDDARNLRWTGFDRFEVGGGTSRTPSSFLFLGTDRDEELSVRFDDAHSVRQHVDMGGGDDILWLGHDDDVGRKGSTYAGGEGRDHVAMWAGRSLDVDLASGRMVTRHKGRKVRSELTGFETQLVGARKLVLQGTKSADELRFYACRATVHGRGGVDDIRQSRGDDYFEGGLRCKPQRIRLFGDGGNDTLRGTLGDDVLVGGRGRDTIEGNGGRDRCSGEKLKSCEIKLR